MNEPTMGQRIAQLRKEQGLTQKELADRMNVTDKAVSKWERDLSCPDISSVPRLAEVLGVGVETLLAEPEEPVAAVVPVENRKGENLIDLVLRVVPFALGIAVTVLGILDQVDPGSTLTGIGLLCLAVYQIRQSNK